MFGVKRSLTAGIVILLLTCACNDAKTSREVKRFASVTGVKPEKLQAYKKLHAVAWPGVLKRIRASNIQNYSIYLKRIEGNYYLFSYFEYVGDNLDRDMRKMAADTITQRWWKETDPCQQPLPDAAEKGKIWSDMEEVFHTN